jgi:hypothetical protein
MAIIHSDRLQLSIDVFTNIFLIFGFLTAFYQFYIINMERSSIEGQITDAIDDLIDQNSAKVAQLKPLKPQLETLQKLCQTDDASTTLTNQSLFTMSWMVTAVFGVLVITLAVSFFGYRTNPYFKQHPLSIGDIIFKNFWMFVVAGGVEFAFFMKIATKFTPVPPSALTSMVVGAMRDEFGPDGSEGGSNACPQRELRAENGERCSNIWICATKKNEVIASSVVGVILLATILAITLQPLAFPFLFTMQPATLKGIEMDKFADLTPKALAEVADSTVIGGKELRGPKSRLKQRPQGRGPQRQYDAGAGFSF